MLKKSMLLLSFVAGTLLSIGVANAQEDSDDQVDVWAVIEQQWDADEKGDKKWASKMLTDDFAGWGKDRERCQRSGRFEFGESIDERNELFSKMALGHRRH